MSRSITVLIGVSKVDGLEPIQGVGPALDKLEAWAEGQGFVSKRFDDLGNLSVNISCIQKYLQQLVNDVDRQPERIFVFFYGHGIMRGTHEEYWLLSDAATIDTEAVNVERSVDFASRSAIGHVAFFGEACRTVAPGDLVHVQGGSIFPRPAAGNWRQPQIDTFYATQFDAPAYEFAGEGIFSKYLIDCLSGNEPEVIEAVANGRSLNAVTASGLEHFLPDRVQLEASKRGKMQRPDCRGVSKYEPNVLAWIPPLRSLSPGAGILPPVPPPEPDDGLGDPLRTPASGNIRDVPSSHPSPPVHDRGEIIKLQSQNGSAVRELAQTYRENTMSTVPARTSVTAVGEPIHQAIIGATDNDLISEDGIWHLNVSEEFAEAALLRFGNSSAGDWAGVATFPGYAAVLVVNAVPFGAEDSAFSVDQLAYLPISTTKVEIAATEVAAQIANVSAKLRLGMFDPAELHKTALTALYDDLNPTLAVLLAHVWSHNGEIDKVTKLMKLFVESQKTLPFDLPLLAHVPWDEVGTAVVPGFPLVTRGWALLDSLPAGEEVLATARRLRVSSPWTSFHHLTTEVAEDLAKSTVSHRARVLVTSP